MPGPTLIDNYTGLNPIDNYAGLNPIDNYTGLNPIENYAGPNPVRSNVCLHMHIQMCPDICRGMCHGRDGFSENVPARLHTYARRCHVSMGR